MRTRFIISLCTCAAMLMAVGASAASADLGTARSVVRPLTGVSASTLNRQVAAGATVPTWTGTITSPLTHKAYKYAMVGNSPLVHETKPATVVSTNVIPVALHFADSGITFDPTAKEPAACLPTGQTADSLLLNSPIFKTHAYAPGGTNIGTVQYVDGFQRENFAKYTINAGATNPGYHVALTAISHAKITVNVPTSAGVTASGVACAGQSVGELDINSWDSFVQNSLLPSLKSVVTPTHFPFFEFYNVVLTDGVGGSCCIIGYHSAYASKTFGGAVQTYGIGDYVTPGLFTNLTDVGAISHEVAEWMDDPFGNNATPAWGHIGQVSGCQANLEVGDPLSGTTPIAIAMPNHVTYHAQELAFRDWFYRTPSVGLHGWFSSFGHFKTNAGKLCS